MAILAPATLPSPAPHPAFRPTPSLQDANVFVSESDAGVTHDIVLPAGRQAYLLCIEGSLAVGTSDAGKHGLQAALLVPLLLLLTFLCSTAACTACCEARACRASAQHRKYHLMLQRSASPLPPLLQTRVLTARIAQLIHEHGARPWQVLAITFTNKVRMWGGLPGCSCARGVCLQLRMAGPVGRCRRSCCRPLPAANRRCTAPLNSPQQVLCLLVSLLCCAGRL